MRHYEVRFHLGEGKCYKHWQIKVFDSNKDGYEVLYYDPAQYQLTLSECQLINKPNKAKKVFNSQKRDVCGWVKCYNILVTDITIFEPKTIDNRRMVVYDPKIRTHWHYENCETDIDCRIFEKLTTIGKRIYCHDHDLSYCC